MQITANVLRQDQRGVLMDFLKWHRSWLQVMQPVNNCSSNEKHSYEKVRTLKLFKSSLLIDSFLKLERQRYFSELHKKRMGGSGDPDGSLYHSSRDM